MTNYANSYQHFLCEPEHTETLIRCFAVLTWVRKLKDEKAIVGDNEIKDLFLATVGCEAVKISTMVYPRDLELSTSEVIF